jgi:hypothetical protein
LGIYSEVFTRTLGLHEPGRVALWTLLAVRPTENLFASVWINNITLTTFGLTTGIFVQDRIFVIIIIIQFGGNLFLIIQFSFGKNIFVFVIVIVN